MMLLLSLITTVFVVVTVKSEQITPGYIVDANKNAISSFNEEYGLLKREKSSKLEVYEFMENKWEHAQYLDITFEDATSIISSKSKTHIFAIRSSSQSCLLDVTKPDSLLCNELKDPIGFEFSESGYLVAWSTSYMVVVDEKNNLIRSYYATEGENFKRVSVGNDTAAILTKSKLLVVSFDSDHVEEIDNSDHKIVNLMVVLGKVVYVHSNMKNCVMKSYGKFEVVHTREYDNTIAVPVIINKKHYLGHIHSKSMKVFVSKANGCSQIPFSSYQIDKKASQKSVIGKMITFYSDEDQSFYYVNMVVPSRGTHRMAEFCKHFEKINDDCGIPCEINCEELESDEAHEKYAECLIENRNEKMIACLKKNKKHEKYNVKANEKKDIDTPLVDYASSPVMRTSVKATAALSVDVEQLPLIELYPKENEDASHIENYAGDGLSMKLHSNEKNKVSVTQCVGTKYPMSNVAMELFTPYMRIYNGKSTNLIKGKFSEIDGRSSICATMEDTTITKGATQTMELNPVLIKKTTEDCDSSGSSPSGGGGFSSSSKGPVNPPASSSGPVNPPTSSGGNKSSSTSGSNTPTSSNSNSLSTPSSSGVGLYRIPLASILILCFALIFII